MGVEILGLPGKNARGGVFLANFRDRGKKQEVI